MAISVRGGQERARTEQIVARVAALSTAPVKGLRLQSRDQIELGRSGAVGDRRFFLIDENDRMLNSRRIRKLSAVVARYDLEQRRLSMAFPDGGLVEGAIELGEVLTPQIFANRVSAALVLGPWAGALADFSGRNVRLVMLGDDHPGTDRGLAGAVSLVSRGSIERLEREAGHGVDPRRFRMTIEVDGLEAHAEDAWIGHQLQIGDTTVRINGHVGRCIVTVLDPDTGRGDMPTLELLRQYRDGADTTEKLALGVYGEVLASGVLRRGDPVRLVG